MKLIQFEYDEDEHLLFLGVPSIITDIKKELKKFQDDGCSVYLWENTQLITIVPPDDYYIIQSILQDNYIISLETSYISSSPNPINNSNARIIEL